MEDPVANVRVLLVDDQSLVRTALVELLQAAPQIEVVASAGEIQEAIRLADAVCPDVVLLDVLSDENSFEGAIAILGHCPTKKIVIVDDIECDARAREAIRINASGYLTKQQPIGQFAAAVLDAAIGRLVFAPAIARRLVFFAHGVQLPISYSGSPLAKLTRREIDVLLCLVEGKTVKQCAAVLGIGTSTAGNHKSRLMKKLDVHKTVELVHLAIREGLLLNRASLGQ